MASQSSLTLPPILKIFNFLKPSKKYVAYFKSIKRPKINNPRELEPSVPANSKIIDKLVEGLGEIQFTRSEESIEQESRLCLTSVLTNAYCATDFLSKAEPTWILLRLGFWVASTYL